jgi:hypothetical protein
MKKTLLWLVAAALVAATLLSPYIDPLSDWSGDAK